MFGKPFRALVLSCVLAVPAHGRAVDAEDAASEAPASDQVIVVTGQREEYGAKAIRTATRTDTDVQDIPQALTVISESQIEDQALRSIADVLTYVPGATSATGEGNRDQITLRGNNTTADFFVDGIRDDAPYYRDLYNVDRVEVLRGSNAMIFGRGGGGGVVNRVTKRPSLRDYREFSLAGDSEGGVRIAGDVDQPLGAGVGLRINGFYENGESFRRGVDLERFAINPTLGLLLGPDTRIDLAYEYLKDRRTADRGVPAFNDRPLRGADRTFFGDPEESFARAEVNLAAFAVEHEFSGSLSLRNRTLYGDYDKVYQNVYPTDLLEATSQVRLSAYVDTTFRENLLSQTDLVWTNQLGGVEQTLLIGFEVGRQDSRNQRRNGFFQPTNSSSILVPLEAPTVDADVIYRPTGANNESEASVAAVYVQDQVELSRQFQLIAGLRVERFGLAARNRNSGATFERSDTLVSPRLGLIVKPFEELSVYASYSRSYLPSSGDQFTSLDLTAEALRPEKFDNYEVGAKWQPVPGLLATAALYQLDRTNTRAPGPNPGETVLTGAQRSRGLEIGLERSISDRWQISAGYAWQKAEITQTTAAAPKGREVPLVPRHQFSVWSRYDLDEALGLGLGIVARSKSFASISNAVTLPGYARLDAGIFYEIFDGIEAQLNVENILGENYFSAAHNDNNIAPGAPRTARATLRFRL